MCRELATRAKAILCIGQIGPALAELAKGGRVDGNITSKVLAVSEGAVFSGQSIMDQQGAQGGSNRGQSAGRVDASTDGEAALAGDAARRG